MSADILGRSLRNLRFLALTIIVGGSLVVCGADWPMQGGNPQHNGWAKGESLISKANVAGLKVLYKYRADNASVGLNSLTAPIVDGNLITYRGFKEMLIFGASSDKVFSVDADLNKLIWESRLADQLADQRDKPQSVTSKLGCPGGLMAPVSMAGSSSSFINFAAVARRIPAVPGARPTRPSPYLPPLWQSVYPMRPDTLTRLAALYTVSRDGKLHVLNSSTGEDLIPAIRFVPPNSKVTSLSFRDNVVYATTGDNCNGFQNALFAIDLLSPEKTVTSFVPQGGGFSGAGGTAIGKDGTVYVQVLYAPGDTVGHYHETTIALTPKELKVKDYFTPGGKPIDRKSSEAPGITPIVSSWMGKEVVLTGSRNGRLYLLDSTSLGGADHHTPLFASSVLAQANKNYDGDGFRGTFSSWLDVDSDTRWFYAPVSGRPDSSAGTAAGGIIALKLTSQNNQPELQQVWVSREIFSPAPVVIANGMLFVLSTGESPRLANKDGKPYTLAEFEQLARPAVLYALDAVTGKELYSSGNAVSSASYSDGLAVANGRVYFTTSDNSVYCFGLPQGQLQLTEQE
jgi:outer membrane protein assembly factor BamB